jgi:RNA polymerase sigma-70 factor (ECF subfamily)
MPDAGDRRQADLQLARRCVAGERAAQRELFQRELDRVHGILWRLLGPQHDLEDATQEAMIALFRSLPGFRGESTLGTWTDRITTRVAYAVLSRKRAARTTLEAVPDVESGDPSAEQRAMHREAAKRLYQVLERLDAKQRLAFALHAIEGRELREVAALMDASLVATKARVWRARREVERRAKKDALLASFLSGGES